MKTFPNLDLILAKLVTIYLVNSYGSTQLRAQDTAPSIVTQPVSKAVSLGAGLVNFSVAASGTSPFSFQWRVNQAVLPLATNSVLGLTNVQFDQAGDYQVVVANGAGSVTSVVAHLVVGPSFLRVASGAVASTSGGTGGAWADFNNDGLADLFVAFGNGSMSMLFTNAGDGTLIRDTGAGIGAGTGSSWGCAWGDFDNDGNLDLLGSVYGGKNYVLHNRGDGTFANLVTNPIARVGTGNNIIWGDFDNDGFLDAYCAGSTNLLFHNNGDGTFFQVTNSVATKDGSGQGCAWGDYDNDGYLDLFVTRVNQPNLLYHNNQDGTFTKISTTPFTQDVGTSQGCSWGDYDNDGLLDLVVCNNNSRNFLYHNDGGGRFTRITGTDINTIAASSGSAWADYDNDGFLDLFVAVRGGVNLLFHNNGDGTFTRVTSGAMVSDSGTWIGAAWGDVNNDGFPDLFVGNLSGKNGLYINGGNSNHWLSISCSGRLSNRAAIGAKVRIKATIRNRTMWQMREVSGGGGLASQNDLRAQFGLGDATNVDIVRVEWPSGAVQELTNVAPGQFQTMREPCKITAQYDSSSDELFLAVAGGRGLVYCIENSFDLTNWTSIGFITNQTGITTWTNHANKGPAKFFRAMEY